MTPGMRAAAQNLAVDLVTAEVAGALGAAGVRAILLKGPSIARWLYGHDELRAYGDTDLLVASHDVAPAEQVLARLGFERLLGDADIPAWRRGDHTWRRTSSGAEVDLHWRLVGVGAPAASVWALLSAGTETMGVAGTDVEILGVSARALHVALHAAQNGIASEQSMADLERALRRLDDGTWRSAAALAEGLDAADAFSTGLRLRPEGDALAGRLGLPAARSVEAALLAMTPPLTAVGWYELSQTPRRECARLVARKVVPSRDLMRDWSPLARRGRAGLLAAYVGRPFWLALHAGPGFAAWRRARRRAATPDAAGGA